MRYGWIFFVVLLACEDKPVKVDLGTDFFPLRTGQEWTYAINKTTFSYVTNPVEESYQLHLAVTDSAISNGVTTYTILVSSRNSATENWQVNASWSARIMGNQAILNESNITRIKLAFPVGPATVWDGDAYNNEPPFLKDYGATADQLLFRIENFNQQKELSGGLNFESTLTVVIRNLFDPIIGQDLQKETYARGVGLVYKEVTQLVFCNQGSCTGKQQGVSYTQTITSYVP